MKPRPRAVENRVAAYLTDLFVQAGMSPVERIPVLGRTGPDISLNELKLVVDVKSRLECPKTYFCGTVCFDFEHWIIPLAQIPAFLDYPDSQPLEGEFPHKYLSYTSALVRGYWSHMDEWTRQYEPDGITAIVMHRPKMPVGRAVLIISKEDKRRFTTRWKQLQSRPLPLQPA